MKLNLPILEALRLLKNMDMSKKMSSKRITMKDVAAQSVDLFNDELQIEVKIDQKRFRQYIEEEWERHKKLQQIPSELEMPREVVFVSDNFKKASPASQAQLCGGDDYSNIFTKTPDVMEDGDINRVCNIIKKKTGKADVIPLSNLIKNLLNYNLTINDSAVKFEALDNSSNNIPQLTSTSKYDMDYFIPPHYTLPMQQPGYRFSHPRIEVDHLHIKHDLSFLVQNNPLNTNLDSEAAGSLPVNNHNLLQYQQLGNYHINYPNHLVNHINGLRLLHFNNDQSMNSLELSGNTALRSNRFAKTGLLVKDEPGETSNNILNKNFNRGYNHQQMLI